MIGHSAQLATLMETLGLLVLSADPAHADPAHVGGAAEAAGHAAVHAGDAHHAAHAAGPVLGPLFSVPSFFALIPFIPLLASVLCGVCAIFKVRTKLPAILTVALLAASFVMTAMLYQKVQPQMTDGSHAVIHAFEWINFQWGSTPAQSVTANFSFYADSLTCLWMLFVTGLATLIALYASEYMSHDLGQGYNRFFAAFGLFVFSMACLVMGDNLALLFLGWEGVGLCSYLLIGYFYKKPSAVAAAKKAFIMNRIGDLGLSLGVMLAYVQFGTIEYAKLFPMLEGYLALAREGHYEQIPFLVQLIPILLTVGAFGKSAQLPLYVWLPDAMEGPTPVSALIHAATMVTAGVYLVARFFPLFLCSEHALTIVAWGGTLTALLAATIGMAQFDIKRIMAYSTVSQLGYMFAGLGVMGAVGGAAHVFTHAFFKALLFLACGAVMHGFAGQLDLRKLSGLRKMPGWRIVSFTMLVGCINLAGLPFITAGFYSKDTILGDAFANPHTQMIGWVLLFTAGLTAYYTFRVFFRVFVGPAYYEPGDEVHAHDDHGHGHDGHGHDGHGHDGGRPPNARPTEGKHAHHDFHPHAPGWAINAVLVILALAAFAAIPLVSSHPHWVEKMVGASTAGAQPPHGEHAKFFGMEAHAAMKIVSGIVAIFGIGIAFVLHYLGRTSAATARADKLLPVFGPLARGAQGKWFVDEVYDTLFVKPLWVLSHVFALIDKILVDGVVNLFGWVPKAVGKLTRPLQSGVLHDYAMRMAGGVAILVLIIVFLTSEIGGGGGGGGRGIAPSPKPAPEPTSGEASTTAAPAAPGAPVASEASTRTAASVGTGEVSR